MLDPKIILKQFSKWTDPYHEFYKYLVCGTEGVYATDGSRIVVTNFYKLAEYRLYDEIGSNHTSEIEIPRGLNFSQYATVQEFIKGHLVEKLERVVKSNSEYVCSEKVDMLSIDTLRQIRQTMNYIVSMNKSDDNKPVYVRLKDKTLYLVSSSYDSLEIKISLHFYAGIEFSGFFRAVYIKDLMDLLISTKTLEFNLAITTGTVPGLVVKSDEFTAIVSGLRANENITEKYNKIVEG